ncbi:MAG: membrane protein [Phycisphaerae bacterium]|nr:MAG: membrane protein [Phycisphaerae bacterium]
MPDIADVYDNIVLRRPVAVLAVITLVVMGFGWFAQDFRLDASSDSLVLERDPDLEYYRFLRSRYGSDNYLIVTYSPRGDLFSEEVLHDIGVLRDKLRGLPHVESVTSILDVPLVMSPPAILRNLEAGIRRLESSETDRQLARAELQTSPLYRDLIVSSDGTTTAMTIALEPYDGLHELRELRAELRDKTFAGTLDESDASQLAAVTSAYDEATAAALSQQAMTITALREVMLEHQDVARMHVGGVPMIVADSIGYIRSDLLLFGAAVFGFLILALSVLFKKFRWTILPLLTCVAASVVLTGMIGMLQWRVTVVSSNFVSLILILCLALTLHFIVRFRELHERQPEASQFTLVSGTVRKIFVPCFYTAMTTIVAFGSLLVSGIRPVIDFGLMMSIGVLVSMLLAFTLFPASLMLMQPGVPHTRNDMTARITGSVATFIRKRFMVTLLTWLLLASVSFIGLNSLSVDNRFIDYYKKSTEIYQGMQLIDRKLGGTTPLDVIIDAPIDVDLGFNEDPVAADDFEDIYADDDEGNAGFAATSYWYNSRQLDGVIAIHEFLDELPDTGKVISLATTASLLHSLEPGVLEDNMLLSVIYKRIPPDIRETLIAPYLSADGQQLRFSVRVFESDPQLKKDALLQTIQTGLQTRFGLEDSQIRLNGMLVLYNNLLRSLFSSQILTLAAVIVAIFLTFIALFRSLKLALVGIVPTAVSAGMVLGLMGWLGIPLDLMTITIAAIAIGIGVDDTIHYVHRFKHEFRADSNYWDAVQRCHLSIGRAIYFTSITVILGFSILVLSRFVPTIHFGVLTSVAMAVALLANITLLPVLIVVFRAAGAGALQTRPS